MTPQKEIISDIFKQYERLCTLDEVMNCQIDYRYYTTGAALGLILDQYAPTTLKLKMRV